MEYDEIVEDEFEIDDVGDDVVDEDDSVSLLKDEGWPLVNISMLVLSPFSWSISRLTEFVTLIIF